METLFIKAIRNKYRFTSTKGHLTVEDLWDLSLTALDGIAISIYDELEKAGKKSFVKQQTKLSGELQNKLDIAKYVIDTKMTEAAAKKDRVQKKGQLDFLKKIKEQKEMQRLENLSNEDLEKQIAALEGEV